MLVSMAKYTRKEPRQALADNVRYLMAKHGDSQKSLADRSGVSQSNISYVVSSDRHVRLDTVDAIAAAYGLEGWHLINPNLPQDLLESATLKRLITTYINSSPEGRALIDAVAERESHYKTEQAS